MNNEPSDIISTKRFFDMAAADLDPFDNEACNFINNLCRPALENAPNKNVLDVGIGAGYQWDTNTDAHEIIGLDFSKVSVNICRRNKKIKDVHCIDITDPNLDWPVPDDYFGLVICKATLAYIRNASLAIARMIRKAAPNGIVIFEVLTPNKETSDTIEGYDDSQMLSVANYFHPKQMVLADITKNGGELIDTAISETDVTMQGTDATAMPFRAYVRKLQP